MFLCVLSCSVMSDSATPWTVAHQASLSMGIIQARILEWVAMLSCYLMRDTNRMANKILSRLKKNWANGGFSADPPQLQTHHAFLGFSPCFSLLELWRRLHRGCALRSGPSGVQPSHKSPCPSNRVLRQPGCWKRCPPGRPESPQWSLKVWKTPLSYGRRWLFLWVMEFLWGEGSCLQFSSAQSLSHVQLFATPWIAACQASLSITNSRSLLKFMPIESVMPSSHLILCRPLLLCLQSLPESGSFPMSQLFAWGGQSIGVSASASVFPMNTQDWSPLGWLVGSPCSPRDSQESSLTPQFKSINFLALSFLHSPTVTFIHDHWKNHSLDQTDLCWQSNVSAF